MADLLYGRRVRLTIAGASQTPGDYLNVTPGTAIEINGGDEAKDPGLRVQFKIVKTDQKDPNTSQIVVTNLSPTRRASLQKKGIKLTLDAGYAATGVARIFRGDARTIDHVRNGPDWDTTFKLGDGERSVRNARYNESFAAGTPRASVLQAVARATGLALGNVPTVAGQLTGAFDQGYSVAGLVSRSFDRLVKSLGYVWSIQDETLQLLLPGATLDGQVPEISPDTGLIGSPEMGTPEKKGKPALVKFKSLLLATRPGAKVKLVSARYNGFVRVKKCTFDGDTRGDNYFTEYEGVLLAS